MGKIITQPVQVEIADWPDDKIDQYPHSLPTEGTANSVTKSYKEGKLDQERYYGDDGKMYLDIDYSNHGNPKMHPKVPHQHKITYDDNGKMHRDSSDTEVK